jgi:hypothetical protein
MKKEKIFGLDVAKKERSASGLTRNREYSTLYARGTDVFQLPLRCRAEIARREVETGNRV